MEKNKKRIFEVYEGVGVDDLWESEIWGSSLGFGF
jgi:hypothetical protein